MAEEYTPKVSLIRSENLDDDFRLHIVITKRGYPCIDFIAPYIGEIDDWKMIQTHQKAIYWFDGDESANFMYLERSADYFIFGVEGTMSSHMRHYIPIEVILGIIPRIIKYAELAESSVA